MISTFRKFSAPAADVKPLENVWQCDSCWVFCDAQGVALCPQPKAGVATIGLPTLVCAECQSGGKEQGERSRENGVGKVKGGRRKEEGERECRRGVVSRPVVTGFERGCPVDTEPLPAAMANAEWQMAEGATPHHREQVASFNRSSEAARRDGEVLGLLQSRFPEPVPGEWVSHDEISKVARIDAVNSCVSRIREQLPAGYDIDSKVLQVVKGKQYWGYRLCRREDSERLRREAERRRKREEEQGGSGVGV